MIPDAQPSEPGAALRSVHTRSFPQLLQELGISVLVTTYQAGKLVVLRAQDGVLNTHFRTMHSPMGLASHSNRLVIGTPGQVVEFKNVPAVARRLEPAGSHDACFMPHSIRVTGNIQIHEMAFAGEELWAVNTRFSCLSTFDDEHSFVPRWRPRFISALAPEDRCHLNGLAMVDGTPRFVTAHGQSDSPAGWRQDKAHGGVLMDVPANEVVVRGLAMPHSPRWHAGELWMLESGAGTIGAVDRAAGRYESIAHLPGFTRGLDFHGRYAFIGLSQVRESAIFSGIPITERPERNCGVWVVDIVTGQTVAFVKFEDALQEIFAVQVLPGARYPDLINDDAALVSDTFVLPDESMADVPEPLQNSTAPVEQEQKSSRSWTEMAHASAKAMSRFVGSGFQLTSPNIFGRRIEACTNCEHSTGARCRVCGCFTRVKARLPLETCPAGKWAE